MNIVKGKVHPYGSYRDHFSPKPAGAVHWAWASILQGLAATAHGERGSLTLSGDGAAAGCELLPGMAINVQVVPARGATRAHAHAWWHLFFVRSGSALARLGDGRICDIGAGDLLLVPAWTDHSFVNDGSEDLVLLSMSNLPQQAALSNHRASEPEDRVASSLAGIGAGA